MNEDLKRRLDDWQERHQKLDNALDWHKAMWNMTKECNCPIEMDAPCIHYQEAAEKLFGRELNDLVVELLMLDQERTEEMISDGSVPKN